MMRRSKEIGVGKTQGSVVLAVAFAVVLVLFVSCATSTCEYDEAILINPFESVIWLDMGYDPAEKSELLIESFSKNNLMVLPIEERISNDFAMGTCFAVSDSFLLTNSHVIDGWEEIYIIRDGDYIPASIVYQDIVNDIAILEVEDPLPYHFSLFDSGKMSKGDTVRVIGFPLADMLGFSDSTVTEGVINSMTGGGDDPLLMQISAEMQNGNSGSPVLNNDFQVVGMAKSLLYREGKSTQNVNFAIKSELLDLVSSHFLASEKIESKEVSSLSQAEQAVFAVVSEDKATFADETGYSEYLMRVGYTCSWDMGRVQIDEMTFELYTMDGYRFFCGTYFGWPFSENYTDPIINDLKHCIDGSLKSYGSLSE